MIQILEVIRRAEQGTTRPYFCRACDGSQYVVKGASAGTKALIAEWLAGQIGRHLELPVPRFSLAELPPLLLKNLSPEVRGDLGAKPVFASQVVEHSEELRYAQVREIPIHQRAQTLAFDCWVRNGDRTLSEHGGNPNILWTPADTKIHLIDHNLAFEDDLPADVRGNHVFQDASIAWDADFRSTFHQSTSSAFAMLDSWWDQIPEEWLEYAEISLEQVKEILWQGYQLDAIFTA
jgi:hypothetical protein